MVDPEEQGYGSWNQIFAGFGQGSDHANNRPTPSYDHPPICPGQMII